MLTLCSCLRVERLSVKLLHTEDRCAAKQTNKRKNNHNYKDHTLLPWWFWASLQKHFWKPSRRIVSDVRTGSRTAVRRRCRKCNRNQILQINLASGLGRQSKQSPKKRPCHCAVGQLIISFRILYLSAPTNFEEPSETLRRTFRRHCHSAQVPQNNID